MVANFVNSVLTLAMLAYSNHHPHHVEDGPIDFIGTDYYPSNADRTSGLGWFDRKAEVTDDIDLTWDRDNGLRAFNQGRRGSVEVEDGLLTQKNSKPFKVGSMCRSASNQGESLVSDSKCVGTGSSCPQGFNENTDQRIGCGWNTGLKCCLCAQYSCRQQSDPNDPWG